MKNKSTLALLAAIVALGIASPASAQSFNKGDGTGNELSFAYGPNGIKPTSPVEARSEQIAAVHQSTPDKVAVRQGGRERTALRQDRVQGPLYDYVGAPPAARSDANENSPALTGGGSTGYNENLNNY